MRDSGSTIGSAGRVAIELGSAAIGRLIPHRGPLELVTRVVGFSAAAPALWAERDIGHDEPVFAGHFPGHPLWPGAYTIEGLAQCSALLLGFARGLADPGADPIQGRARALTIGQLAAGDSPPIALLAAVEVRLLAPVRAGDRLAYAVEVTHTVGELVRLRVEAQVGERGVARGTLTVASSGALAVPG